VSSFLKKLVKFWGLKRCKQPVPSDFEWI
jgi:hypothetical protein